MRSERRLSLDVTRLWRSERALQRARENALRIAREKLAQRRREEKIVTHVMHDAHTGHHHLDLFRREMPQTIAPLPPNFQALEIGAGMCIFASLLAAHGAGRVIATEVLWGDQVPQWQGNAHTLARLSDIEPKLKEVLKFTSDAERIVRRVDFSPVIQLARASAHALPVSDGSLDLIYSINCLEHIPSVGSSFGEAARALRVGGIYFATTEPLFFSSIGHHCSDIFPLPWGHLLWEPEELAEVMMREAGEGREWLPGEPMSADHLVGVFRNELNGATPAEIRRGLMHGPWKILGWADLLDPGDVALAREIGLRDALRGVSAEALFLIGMRMRLQRCARPNGLRLPFRLSHRARRRLRRIARGGR